MQRRDFTVRFPQIIYETIQAHQNISLTLSLSFAIAFVAGLFSIQPQPMSTALIAPATPTVAFKVELIASEAPPTDMIPSDSAPTAIPNQGQSVTPSPTVPAELMIGLPNPLIWLTKKSWQSGSNEWQLQARIGKGTVNDVAWSPDGNHIAVASSYGIYFFDSVTLAETRFFETGVWINSVAFSPDGLLVAAGGRDAQIRVWQVDTSRLILELEEKGDVIDLAFSPDGSRLASASLDDSFRIWNVAQGSLEMELKGHDHNVYAVVFSPDGTLIASGSYDNKIIVWNAGSGEQVSTLAGHTGNVATLAFSPDGSKLASGSWDNTVRLWDVQTGTTTQILSNHVFYVSDIAFSPDGQILATAGWDGSVKLWDSGSGQILHSSEAQADIIQSIAYSPDGLKLVIGLGNGQLQIADGEKGSVELAERFFSSASDSIVFTPDGNSLLSHSDGSSWIDAWDLITGEPEDAFLETDDEIVQMALSPDGQILATTVGYSPYINIWDTVSKRILITLDTSAWSSSDISYLAFSPDGHRLASTNRYPSTIFLWNTETWTTVGSLEGHSSEVLSLAFSPDSSRLASSDVNSVIIWDLTLMQSEWSFPSKTSFSGTSMAFFPDSNRLATVGEEGIVYIWNTDTYEQIQSLSLGIHEQSVVAVSPDGQTLAAGTKDGTVILWDVDNKSQIQSLDGHTIDVITLSFSSDGSTLASTSYDGTIHLWRRTQESNLFKYQRKIFEEFDHNSYEWPIGDVNDSYSTGSFFFGSGKYRVKATAKQAFSYYLPPRMEPLDNMYVAADFQLIESESGILYGLYLWDDPENSTYYFAVNESLNTYNLIYWDMQQWTVLIDNNYSPAIQPGQVNRLGIIAVQGQIHLFINDQWITTFENDNLTSGLVALALDVPYEGYRVIINFDNFDVWNVSVSD